MKKLNSILILATAFIITSAHADYFDEGKKALGLSMVGNLELRKNQQTELEKVLAAYTKRFSDTQKTISSTLNKIKTDLAEAQQKLKDAPELETDFLNKKIAILHDRRQNLFDYQDLWQDIIKLLNAHIKLVSEIIDFLQTAKPELKPTYTWKEFRELQIRISEQLVKIQSDKTKRENLKKQKVAITERLSSLERQRDALEKERGKIVTQLEGSDTKAFIDTDAIKFDSDRVSQELSNMHEKIAQTKLIIEKLDAEIKYSDDLITLEQSKYDDQKNLLTQAENRLILDYNDVDIAKNDWKNEIQKSLTIKEDINVISEPKKQNKEKLIIERETLHQKITTEKNKGIADPVNYTILKAQYRQITALIGVVDKELQLLDARKLLADTRAHEKELQYNIIELRYKLKIESENIDLHLADFTNKRDIAFGTLKALKDKRTEAISSLIETNRAIEKIKSAHEKLTTQKAPLFKGHENELNKVSSLLDQTRQYLILAISFTQSMLAVNADLITNQEKILNQYNLIIQELESQHKIYSIWKRSPKAISLDALSNTLIEGESFLKNLYWQTPTYFKPSTFINTFTGFTLTDLLFIVLFILLYVVSFIGFRYFLTFSQNKIQKILEIYQGHTRYLYLHLVQAAIQTLLANFKLFFLWFFIFIHIKINFTYFFISFAPWISNYSTALFHLASIPLFVYMARQFIDALREVNKKLSYFFFAETFQDKFILLVTIFCYATAILLPLRMSILAYADSYHSEASTVIIAAYSLILIIVAALLFNKEDILKLIPSHTPFFIWLKRKIDKHFYQAFLFIMLLLVLSNPYIGYSNMAWFLAFAIPSSGFLLYALFIAHFYIRKYAVFLFMKEEEEDIIDKFEHAKAYYGFFVIFSFLFLLFITSMLMLRIWGFDYTPSDIWNVLAEQWVIPIGINNKLGFVEFMIFGLFIAGGFFVSSMIHKFILNKLFEIIRSEPGTQNTISRIIHYSIIFFAIILGLNAIHLEQFIWWVGASFGIVLGLALKDFVTDFIAGFFVLIERPIEIGNYVQIDNVQGTVHKIAARATTIITSRNHSIIIPNKDLVSKWIINWGHGRFAVGFEINIRVEANTNPELVKKVLFTTIQSNPLILKVPGVVVRLEDIEDNGFYFLTRAFISARRVKEQWELAAALRTEIIKAFKENNINLAFPTRIVHLRGDGNTKEFKSIDIKFDK